MIMKSDLHMNAFSNDRFSMARDRSHYPQAVKFLSRNFSPGACVMPWEFPEESKPVV